jgi:hypothetical protein
LHQQQRCGSTSTSHYLFSHVIGGFGFSLSAPALAKQMHRHLHMQAVDAAKGMLFLPMRNPPVIHRCVLPDLGLRL